MQETKVWSLGWEDSLEKGMATHFSILVWDISWWETMAGYSPQLHRFRDNLATKLPPPSPVQFLGQPRNSYWKIYLKSNKVRNCEQTKILSYVHSLCILYTWIDTRHLNQRSAFIIIIFIFTFYFILKDRWFSGEEPACNTGDCL